MPVEDLPVHPKTIRADGALWGCSNAKRQRCYWAPDGYRMAQVGEHGNKVVLPQMKWIVDTSSTDCHNDTRFVDPACAGCKKLLT